MLNLDIVDIAIGAVGISMLPIVPDLLANLLVAFLPDSMVTARVLHLSRSIRAVTTKFVSFILVAVSVVLPGLGLYFMPDMIRFHTSTKPSQDLPMPLERGLCVVLAALVELTYFTTILTCPGYTPLGPGAVKGGGGSSNKGEKGMCKTCDAPKPPRAHHCSVCGRCVLRMDHHCPFTNCCIGLYNERFFLLWVFLVWVGCVYGTWMSWSPFYECIVRGIVGGIDSISPGDLERCTDMGKTVFIFLPTFTLVGFMTILFGWHLMLISQDWTTLEFFRFRLAPLIGQPADKPAPETGRGGVIANFRGVLFPSSPHC